MNLFTKSVSVDAAFGQYCAWLATTRTLAERTRIEYRDDVRHLVDFLSTSCHVAVITAVERAHLVRYLDALTTAGQAASTRRRTVAAIRSFFRFLVQEGILPRDPSRLLLPPLREERPPRVLTEAEYGRVRGAAPDARATALVELVLQTGLTLGEISRLPRDDVALPFPTTLSQSGAFGSRAGITARLP